jgi:CubicO group peptidase (beta-lactamase class C family)
MRNWYRPGLVVATLVVACGALAADVPCRGRTGQDRLARWTTHLQAEAADGFRGDVRVVQGDSTLFHGRYAGSSSDSTDGAFWIGSITKTFTAVTIVRLVEEGKLALDAPLGTYLADVPERWRGVTIHHLLGHRAGFPDNYPADGIADRAEAIRRLLDQEPVKPPGQFQYSNDGYALLGILVELASGQSFEAAVRERILVPARLTHTGFWGAQVDSIPVAPPDEPARAKRMRPTIWKEGRSVANYGYRGSGGMWSTTEDLARYVAAFHAGRLVSPANVTLMTTSKKADPPREGTSYGYGWGLTLHEGRTTSFWHGGNEDWQGHNGYLRRDDDGRTYAILSDSGDVDGEGWSHRIMAGLEACDDQ